MATPFPSTAFLAAFFLASCTNGSSPALAPVEQLPNPEFVRKPQMHFVVDGAAQFWNLPVPAELEAKQRVRLTLQKSSEPKELEASLRELNAREGDLLIFSGFRMLPVAKSLSLFSPPSGRPTFYFEAEAVSAAGQVPMIRLELGPVFDLLKTVCARWQKDLHRTCVWDPKIPGAPKTSASSRDEGIPIAFDNTSENTRAHVMLKIDWVQWTEQFLHDLTTRAKIDNASWHQVSLNAGTLRLELRGEDPQTTILKKVLQEERLKRL